MSTDETIPSAASAAPAPIKHEDFYNKPLERGLDYRKKSAIYCLRNFNNWVKSNLIGDYIARVESEQPERRGKLEVFDLGCGKGGDLLKWKIGNVHRVIFGDLAPEALKVCEERVRSKNCRYKTDYVLLDCRKGLLRDSLSEIAGKPIGPCLDLVSTQFVIHYSFDKFSSVDRFIRNAGELLRIGGYFIGTTVDACRLVERCRQTPDQTLSNDIFRIEFDKAKIDLDKSEEIPLFGAEYIFTLDELVNCPEYLIYFPLLVAMAEKHGMKLVERCPFKEYFELKSKTRNGADLLKRMDALDQYSLSSDDSGRPVDHGQFEHGAEFIRSKNETNQQPISACRTMSKQEWEVESLYIVFAFQKVRHIEYKDAPPPPLGDHDNDISQ